MELMLDRLWQLKNNDDLRHLGVLGDTHLDAIRVDGVDTIRVDGGLYDGCYRVEEGVTIREGQGKFRKDGDTYSGGWHNNKMNGKGTMHYTHCSRLFVDAAMKNRLSCEEGIYTGSWTDNTRHGIGKMTWRILEEDKQNNFKWHQYTGDWRNDKMEGRGTMTHADGYEYVCNWKNNEPLYDTVQVLRN